MTTKRSTVYLLRQSDGAVLTFDAVGSIDRKTSSRATRHPVEDGSTTSDHVQREPDRFSVKDAIVSESPLAGVGSRATGLARVSEALAWFEESQGELVSLGWRGELYENLVVTGFPYSYDKLRRRRFSISLEQIRIARADVVFVDLSDVDRTSEASDASTGDPVVDEGVEAGFASEVDAGEQASTDVSSEPSDEDNRSALAALVDSFGE